MNALVGMPGERRILMGVRLLDRVEGTQQLLDRAHHEDAARSRARALLGTWRDQGVTHVLDVSPVGYARDLEVLTELADAAGVGICCVTGLGPVDATPPALACLGVLELADLLVGELSGDDRYDAVRTLLCAGERPLDRVVDAVAIAHATTRAPVVVDAPAGMTDVVRRLTGRGVEPEAILVVGVDASTTPFARINDLSHLGVHLALTGDDTLALVACLLVALDRMGPERTFVGPVDVDLQMLAESLEQHGVEPVAITRLLGVLPPAFTCVRGHDGG